MEGGEPRTAATWMLAATAGSTLVGTVVAGIILDVQFGWSPWATLIGLAVGMFSCISVLIRAANQSRREP